MKKKDLGLKFSYHLDEKNRCVVCWLDYRYGDFYEFFESPISKYTGLYFHSVPYIKKFLPSDGKIKTVAKAYTGDKWDPEGLKKLARMKAERSFYKRMKTAALQLRKDLMIAQSELYDVEHDYSRWFSQTDQKITDPKFYENWRAKEIK